MKRRLYSHVLTTILTVCAVIVTGLVVRREFTTVDNSSARVVTDWQNLIRDRTMIGDADAGEVVVAFIDFQCPFCAQAAVTLDSLLARMKAS